MVPHHLSRGDLLDMNVFIQYDIYEQLCENILDMIHVALTLSAPRTKITENMFLTFIIERNEWTLIIVIALWISYSDSDMF